MPSIDKAIRRDNKIVNRRKKKHNRDALASEQQKRLKEEKIKHERKIKRLLYELGFEDK